MKLVTDHIRTTRHSWFANPPKTLTPRAPVIIIIIVISLLLLLLYYYCDLKLWLSVTYLKAHFVFAEGCRLSVNQQMLRIERTLHVNTMLCTSVLETVEVSDLREIWLDVTRIQHDMWDSVNLYKHLLSVMSQCNEMQRNRRDSDRWQLFDFESDIFK